MTYPFSENNNRIFYACQGVFVKGRNTQTGDTSPHDCTFLTGVSSVGINGSFPSESLLDVGRAQQQYHFYSPQQFEITIERTIDEASNFFYYVDPSDYVATSDGYQNTHILADRNIGCQGETNPNSKSLRNYDITVLYGSDSFNRLGSNISDGGDGNKVFSITYRNCLVTAISYTIGADGPVTESITLISRGATHNESNQTASNYTIPVSGAPQSANLIKRSDFDLLSSSPYSVLPTEVTTIFKAEDSSGDFDTLNGEFILGITSVTIDVAIEYSEVSDVGKWRGSVDQGLQNVWRYVTLPIQVTSSFTGVVRQPYARDLPNTDTTFSSANGSTSSTSWDRANKEIKLVAEKFPSDPTTTYYVWDLGKSNYLTDFSFSGGDTGGGNLEATMSYQNDASDIVIVKDTNVRDLPKPSTPY
tara:strand:+ start:2984 stop:4237 length:1254 start_codon:yes stop_codon:yes gene_type:complete